MAKNIICFGEMLWDCFPDEDVAGGAPMNVALNLQQLRLDVAMISRLGSDEYGDKMRAFLQSYSFPMDLVQTDEFNPTGLVKVDNSDKEHIKYEIVEPSAWDFISLSEKNQQAVAKADALIFGSLAVRNDVSWQTLYHLVHQPLLTVFDINLRAPFIDFYKIDSLLGYTDVLKINEDELDILLDFFELKASLENREKVLCEYLEEAYPISCICITQGSKGAMMYQEGKFYKHDGYKVAVKDTVGAGDAFLAGFVKNYLQGNRPLEILDFATKIGAYVASQKGGTHKYTMEDIQGIGSIR
ncbi:carbohydrate kinase [Belliella sp. DSM 111904]|uniref:Carbohydrate kinase n=1 Tax=Belliella filtrata TaxID=2923435 RepID=A0ABS9UWB3_9BACT|nr:carbohydrate kinase [Belliella filtrata]MCH7408249.1 carbohydrate kinase [Belliella filtrata]